MRAVQIRTFGEPGIVLELADLPEPSAPAAGQVLIGVEHAPINMNDLYLIQGVYPVRPSLPSVVGNEGVGRVLAIGRGVDHLKVGDRVLVPLYSFSWRERLVAPAAGLFALPEADPRQLAMLGINPPTAALLLNESIDLRPGDWVAQNAANSGVGRSLIAIAKTRGLKTINFVRRPELVPELQAVGGDLVIVDQSGAIDKIRATIGDARVPLGIDGVAGKASATIAGVLSQSLIAGADPRRNGDDYPMTSLSDGLGPQKDPNSGRTRVESGPAGTHRPTTRRGSPLRLALARVLQCVAFWGFVSSVHRTTRSTCASVICRGAP